MPVTKTELSFPFNAEFPTVCCPACGSVVQRGYEEFELPTCPHLEFAYLDDIGEFSYLDPKLEAVVEELESAAEKEGKDFYPTEALTKNLEGNTRLILSIETNGMGHGPTSSLVLYGFNFLPQAD